MIFKNSKVYDILKWVASVGFPALTAFWLAIGQIWNIPYTNQIGATLAAITAFACALLGISSIKYKLAANTTEEEK